MAKNVDEVVDLKELSKRLGEDHRGRTDRLCTRPPTVEELEELDPRELARLLQICDLL